MTDVLEHVEQVARERGWPVWRGGDAVLVCADCLQVLPTLCHDVGSFRLPRDTAVCPRGDCRLVGGEKIAIVSDPPYGVKNNCGYSRFSKGGNDWSDIAGDEKDFDPRPFLRFPEIVLWGANHFAANLPRGTWLVWQKYQRTSTFQSDAELAWLNRGGKVLVFSYAMHATGEFPSDSVRQRFHPTEKPICLLEWCLSLVKTQLICDPYMGSGTTGVACIRTGRRFLGIEIDRRYWEIAIKRCEAELNRHPLFEPASFKQQEMFP